MRRAVLLVIPMSILEGCANLHTVMENPETHQTLECSAWGWGIAGTTIAVLSHNDCVDNLKQRGYTKEVER